MPVFRLIHLEDTLPFVSSQSTTIGYIPAERERFFAMPTTGLERLYTCRGLKGSDHYGRNEAIIFEYAA
jgi:hypothetical protein